ncbi:head-tail connector protein [Bacillus altitudinis]|uniref:head-tail connector protein n=1 Tax=Bacillus altitudinis TaxID=293387 RepID=UPI002235A4EB|nr:head-tail connector protein [Bacillus altitudinis]
MNQLKDFKTLIDEEVEDAVLQLYINDAENFILNHCNLDEVPNRLYSALLNIAVYLLVSLIYYLKPLEISMINLLIKFPL